MQRSPNRKGFNVEKSIEILDRIMQYELAGVVRYTHYALMIKGPNRMPLVAFMKAQAVESLTHAQAAGEILTGLDGHPSLKIAPVEECHQHSVHAMVEESYEHEMHALGLYKELLAAVANKSVYLEEYARGMIGQEEQHTMELRKMLGDYTDTDEQRD